VKKSNSAVLCLAEGKRGIEGVHSRMATKVPPRKDSSGNVKKRSARMHKTEGTGGGKKKGTHITGKKTKEETGGGGGYNGVTRVASRETQRGLIPKEKELRRPVSGRKQKVEGRRKSKDGKKRRTKEGPPKPAERTLKEEYNPLR